MEPGWFVDSEKKKMRATSLVGSVRIIIYLKLCFSCCRNYQKALKTY